MLGTKALFVMLGILALSLPAGGSQPATNLFVNGNFEADANGDGIPDGWYPNPDRKLGSGEGRNGSKALTIACPGLGQLRSRDEGGGWTTKAYGLKEGRAYRLSWWWKCPDKPGRCSMVKMYGMPTLMSRIYKMPGRDWRQEVVSFVAQRDITPREWSKEWNAKTNALFMIAVNYPAILYVDDVELREIPTAEVEQEHLFKYIPNPLRKHLGREYFGPIWPQKQEGNLVPNASFELGARAWGSSVPDTPGTIQDGDKPYCLMSKVDHTQAMHGESSLRIEMDGDNLPDCLNPVTGNSGFPATTLYAATFGLIPMEEKHYVLSAWLKADAPGTVATLTMTGERGGRWSVIPFKRFTVGTEWQRCSLSFLWPVRDTSFVIPLIGPDWQLTGRKKCTLWVDGVQLEQCAGKNAEPTPFCTREGVQVALDTEKLGNILEKGDNLCVTVHAFNGTEERADVSGKLTATDYWDREIFSMPLRFALDAGKGMRRSIDTKIARAGFYRVRFFRDGVREPADTIEYDNFPVFANFQDLRSAIIRPYDGSHHPGFPRMGWEHAQGWKELWQTFRKAGLGYAKVYFRPDSVEPVEGEPDYSAHDKLIDNLQRNGIAVLATIQGTFWSWNSPVPYDLSGCFQPNDWIGYYHYGPFSNCAGGQDIIRSVKRPGGGWAVEFDTTEKMNHSLYRIQQRDKFQLQKGKKYRIGFFARSAGSKERKAHVVLMTYPECANAGLDQTFTPAPDYSLVPGWKPFHFDFTCTASTELGSSLQFYLEEPGVLGIDDASLREALPENKLGPELVVNGNFEKRTLASARWRVAAIRLPNYHIYGHFGNSTTLPPPDMDKVREFYRRLVIHFKDRIKLWEFLHETYFPDFGDICRYIKAAYEGIKAADPEAKVVCGCTGISIASHGERVKLWNSGMNKYFDGTSFSGYEGKTPPEALAGHLEDLREWQDENGGFKPIYHTEGWRWADDDPMETPWEVGSTYGPFDGEKEYGDYVVRYSTALFGNGVEIITLLPTSPMDGVGSPWPLKILEYGLVPCKAYPVHAGFAQIVTPDAHIYRKMQFFDNSIYAYVFKRTQDAVAVIWAPEKTCTIERSLLKGVKVLDIFGEPIADKRVPITTSAIYLVGDSAETVVEAVNGLKQARMEQIP